MNSNRNFNPSFLLFLSAILPHSIFYTINQQMLVLKIILISIFILLSKKTISLNFLLIGLLIIFSTLLSSLFSEQSFSLTRLALYSFCVFLFTIRFYLDHNTEFYKRLYIITVFILTIISLIYPNIINFFYGWNSIDQQSLFLDSEKYVSIFGLPATASLSYGIIIFLLIDSYNLFRKSITITLILFFGFLLISLKSSSSAITFIFLVFYFIIVNFKKLNFYLFFSIFIFLILFIYIYLIIFDISILDLFNFRFYQNVMSLSFDNRFGETLLESTIYGYPLEDFFFGLGFTSTDLISFGDIGYFDNLIRLGVFGMVFFYFMYYQFIKRHLSQSYYLIIIFFLFILELGHTYSKSIVFLPIIMIILFNFNSRKDYK